MFEKFTVIPSIDLKGGQVVRLLHGDMSRVTVYGGDPGVVARGFEEAGAELIHIVDLDGAIAGVPRNVDPGAIDEYLTYQYVPHPNTIFRGIRKLPPAHYAVWRDGQMRINSYWQPDFNRLWEVDPGRKCRAC